jgi:hypothetical protein
MLVRQEKQPEATREIKKWRNRRKKGHKQKPQIRFLPIKYLVDTVKTAGKTTAEYEAI